MLIEFVISKHIFDVCIFAIIAVFLAYSLKLLLEWAKDEKCRC